MLAYILSIVFILWAAASAGIGIYISRRFVFSKSKSMEFTKATCIENGDFTQQELDSYELSDFETPSDYGYLLRGVFSRGTDPTRTVVFVHGHTWSWYGQVKYFDIYRRRGYNLVAYNHRYHGDSGGENCTAGLIEKRDLLTIARWAREQFPQTEVFGVMGESLGAATSLQYMGSDQALSFVHADCPFSDMLELYTYQMKINHIPSFLRPTALAACRRYLRRKAGFDPIQVSPKAAILTTDVPLLLVHGKEDRYVPTSMSIAMYESRKDRARTELLLVDGARHAQSIIADRKTYTDSVNRFLDSIGG